MIKILLFLQIVLAQQQIPNGIFSNDDISDPDYYYVTQPYRKPNLTQCRNRCIGTTQAFKDKWPDCYFVQYDSETLICQLSKSFSGSKQTNPVNPNIQFQTLCTQQSGLMDISQLATTFVTEQSVVSIVSLDYRQFSPPCATAYSFQQPLEAGLSKNLSCPSSPDSSEGCRSLYILSDKVRVPGGVNAPFTYSVTFSDYINNSYGLISGQVIVKCSENSIYQPISMITGSTTLTGGTGPKTLQINSFSSDIDCPITRYVVKTNSMITQTNCKQNTSNDCRQVMIDTSVYPMIYAVEIKVYAGNPIIVENQPKFIQIGAGYASKTISFNVTVSDPCGESITISCPQLSLSLYFDQGILPQNYTMGECFSSNYLCPIEQYKYAYKSLAIFTSCLIPANSQDCRTIVVDPIIAGNYSAELTVTAKGGSNQKFIQNISVFSLENDPAQCSRNIEINENQKQVLEIYESDKQPLVFIANVTNFFNFDRTQGCPVIFELKELGCQENVPMFAKVTLNYETKILIATKTDEPLGWTQYYCLEASNKISKVQINNLIVKQYPSCKIDLQFKESADRSIKKGSQSKSLFEIKQRQKLELLKEYRLKENLFWPYISQCQDFRLKRMCSDQKCKMILTEQNSWIYISPDKSGLMIDASSEQIMKKLYLEIVQKFDAQDIYVVPFQAEVFEPTFNFNGTQNQVANQINNIRKINLLNLKIQKKQNTGLYFSQITKDNKILQKLQNQLNLDNLELQGFLLTWAGYTLPGLDKNQINDAEKNYQKMNESTRQNEPFAKVHLMNSYGEVAINFTHKMMVPTQEMEQPKWGSIFKVSVIPIDDGLVFNGKFNQTKSKKRLEENVFAFKISVKNFSENSLVLKFNFDNLNLLDVTNQAFYRIELLDKFLLKTKKTMAPLQGFQNEELDYVQREIPPQIYNIEQAKNMIKILKVISTGLVVFCSGAFVVSILLQYIMEQFWGSIRTMQIMFLSSLIDFNKTVILSLYFEICVQFAKKDIFSGEEFFGNILNLKETSAVNDQFEFYGIDNQIMFTTSGSFFVILTFIIVFISFKLIINSIAKIFAIYQPARLIGIMVYSENTTENAKNQSQKLLLENYFEISISTLVNVHALVTCQNQAEFNEFFIGASNILNSSLEVILIIALITLLTYSTYMIIANYEKLDQNEFQQKLKIVLDGSKQKSLSSSLINVYFMIRRLFTAIILVWFYDFPSLQNQALTLLSFSNLTYIAMEQPYDQFRTNIVEAFNEFCILICFYMMHSFLISDDIDFSNKLSWVFIISNLINIFVNISIILFDLVTKLYQDLKKVIENYKENQNVNEKFSNLEVIAGQENRYVQDLEPQMTIQDKIEMLKKWWPHRKWLMSFTNDFHNFPEEIQFQNYISDLEIISIIKQTQLLQVQHQKQLDQQEVQNQDIILQNMMIKLNRRSKDFQVQNKKTEFEVKNINQVKEHLKLKNVISQKSLLERNNQILIKGQENAFIRKLKHAPKDNYILKQAQQKEIRGFTKLPPSKENESYQKQMFINRCYSQSFIDKLDTIQGKLGIILELPKEESDSQEQEYDNESVPQNNSINDQEQKEESIPDNTSISNSLDQNKTQQKDHFNQKPRQIKNNNKFSISNSNIRKTASKSDQFEEIQKQIKCQVEQIQKNTQELILQRFNQDNQLEPKFTTCITFNERKDSRFNPFSNRIKLISDMQKQNILKKLSKKYENSIFKRKNQSLNNLEEFQVPAQIKNYKENENSQSQVKNEIKIVINDYNIAKPNVPLKEQISQNQNLKGVLVMSVDAQINFLMRKIMLNNR